MLLYANDVNNKYGEIRRCFFSTIAPKDSRDNRVIGIRRTRADTRVSWPA